MKAKVSKEVKMGTTKEKLPNFSLYLGTFQIDNAYRTFVVYGKESTRGKELIKVESDGENSLLTIAPQDENGSIMFSISRNSVVYINDKYEASGSLVGTGFPRGVKILRKDTHEEVFEAVLMRGHGICLYGKWYWSGIPFEANNDYFKMGNIILSAIKADAGGNDAMNLYIEGDNLRWSFFSQNKR